MYFLVCCVYFIYRSSIFFHRQVISSLFGQRMHTEWLLLIVRNKSYAVLEIELELAGTLTPVLFFGIELKIMSKPRDLRICTQQYGALNSEWMFFFPWHVFCAVTEAGEIRSPVRWELGCSIMRRKTVQSTCLWRGVHPMHSWILSLHIIAY